MTKLIFDCDPGVDDAVALFLAFASPQDLEILAITTVAGNVAADLTARNAAVIRQIAGREDVPIHAGAQSPLVRAPIEAGHFHGESGLGALPLFEPARGAMESLLLFFTASLMAAVISLPERKRETSATLIGHLEKRSTSVW